jgi:chitinase
MNLRRTALAVGAAAALLVGTATIPSIAEAATTTAATNLLSNPGFESGSLSPWTCAGSGAVVTAPVHTGAYALSNAATSGDVSKCSQTVSVQPSSSYSLSGYVTGSYTILGVSGTGTTDTSTWASGSSWSNVTTTFTTGASTKSVQIYTSGWYGQGTYGADDLSLTGPAGSGTTPPPPTAPAAPTGLAASATTSSSVTLGWNAPSGATSYTVYRGGTKVGTATSTSFTDSSLTAATAYSYAVTASNGTGESPKSSTISASTAAASGGSGGGTGGGTGTGPASQLPKHLLTGYWQDFTNGATSLRLSDVPTTYNLVAVAFATTDPTTAGAVTFSIDSGLSTALGGYTAAQFTSDIATLHARGQKVILSVGGQDGTITVSNSAQATAFASSVSSLMNTYGFDGVDIDLENGVNPTYMAQALHSIAAAHPGAIITMAPQTIDMLNTTSDYFALALAVKDVLTIVNTQYYNSGSMNGCDGNVFAQGGVNFITALACTDLQGGLAASQIGLGLPASSSGAGSGYVSPTIVNNALTCLASGTGCGSFVPSAKYPTIRGAMDWSINWDASNGYQFANAVSAQLKALP